MRKILLLVVLIIAGLLGIYGYVQSGLFNVAATVQDGPLLSWLLHTTMENSVERRAGGIEVPKLEDRELIFDGVSDYAGMCAQCHGEPGSSPSPIRQGLNPTPPALGDLAQEASAAEMFWIISNGIRMSGMPAFGKTHGPDEIWPVVAFLQSARNITAADYDSLKTASRGHGHHHDDMEDQGHESQHHDALATGTLPEDAGIEQHHEHDEMGPDPSAGQ